MKRKKYSNFRQQFILLKAHLIFLFLDKQSFQNNFDKTDILIKTDDFIFCKKYPYKNAREE